MNESAHSESRHPKGAGTDSRRTFGLDRKLSPEEINCLEMAAYRGPTHVVGSRQAMLSALKDLRRETLLGFDTEKRPSFKKGESHPPALLQLAGSRAVYVFQLYALGLPVELAGILADARIAKAGVAITRDLQELRQLDEFQPAGFVDLGVAAMRCGIQHHGLRGLAAVMLGCRISKGARLTNWERPDLPRTALQYAATDAWIGRRIYKAMQARGCFAGHDLSP